MQHRHEKAERDKVIEAFRKARKTGEKLLCQGKIPWEEYAATMVGYELIQKEMGEHL